MKEATGELNMTVITVLIIGALGAALVFVVPLISSSIKNSSCNAMGDGWTYRKIGDVDHCCPANVTDAANGCIPTANDVTPAP